MFPSIAAEPEILNAEAVEVAFGDTEEFWISVETTGPVGPESLSDVLGSLPEEDRRRAYCDYDTEHAKFFAPDEGGDRGFLQWWYLARRPQSLRPRPEECPMSESKPGAGPTFRPGDGLLRLDTKAPGRVTAFGGAEFDDGAVLDSIDLRAAWQAREVGWSPRNRIGRARRS